MQQGVGAARRASQAIARRVRAATGKVDAGVGVGDDESSFGGQRSQVWFEFLEEAKARLRVWLEKSTFDRFPGLERFLTRILGKPAEKKAPSLPPPVKPTGPLGAHTPPTSPEAEAFRAQIHQGMLEGHMRERAGAQEIAGRQQARVSTPSRPRKAEPPDSD